MKNLDKLNQSVEFRQKVEEENIHEIAFSKVINNKILEEFEDDLDDVVDADESVDKILDEINAFDLETQKGLLSIPKSIRRRRMKILLERYFKNQVETW